MSDFLRSEFDMPTTFEVEGNNQELYTNNGPYVNNLQMETIKEEVRLC